MAYVRVRMQAGAGLEWVRGREIRDRRRKAGKGPAI